MKKLLAGILLLTLFITGCGDSNPKTKPELIFYIGITMVKPITVLADNFMKKNNCNIRIVQGGSQDLYDSLSASGKGDLYLPGSLSYRNKNIKQGLLLDGKFIGYNKAAMMVKKGNPKHIPSDLNALTNREYNVVLCNPESGSVGKETKNILTKFGNYEEAMKNAAFLTTDSRNLTKAIKSGTADVCINWYATTKWDSNKYETEAIIIDEKYAKKKKLVLNLLKSSKHPELVKSFMKYAASIEGRQVLYEYGFLDDKDLAEFDSITF